MSDGFTRPYPNIDTFTGACMKGGSAATQGNDMLIPTPALPPCASAICSAEPLPSPKAISVLDGGPVTRTGLSELRARSVRILSGPEIERATQHLTIIRWSTNNPGGSPVHYALVHYGTRPDRMLETAVSPIRLSPDHTTTLFRVRIDRLHEGTTYYFKVDSEGADGMRDGAESKIRSFVIR